MGDIGRIIKSLGLLSHACANDVWVYSTCQPSETYWLRSSTMDCISTIRQWTEENQLSLNPDKTEVLCVSASMRKHLISWSLFTIGNVNIVPRSELHLLRVLLDELLSFIRHLDSMTRTCHYQIHRIKKIRRYLPLPDVIKLVRTLILTRLD